MCGIVAFYRPDGTPTQAKVTSEKQLAEALASIRHRGPDASGVYISENGRLGLGHVRLSIVDIQGGDQPLHDATNTVHVVVNGELYDYDSLRKDLERRGCCFLTKSDSELVVHLYKVYGINFFTFLRGEFAFVLYDSSRGLLLAARDRFGIKPLFYTVVDGRLLVASEMKAFLALGWRPQWDVKSIVHMGDFYDNRTVFQGVFKIPPAHCLTFDLTGSLKLEEYWATSFPPQHVVETLTLVQMIEGVRARLIEAVRQRLHSDVPIAVFLSGGIDSAAVAGIANILMKEKDPQAKLDTFTLSFPELGPLDEGPVASRMADLIGANAHMVRPTEEELISYFEKSVWHGETPVLSLHSAGRMVLSETVRNAGFKVVLTGEGSDEIFGGYIFLLWDFLRATDSASKELGFPLPTFEDLRRCLDAVEKGGPPLDQISLTDMSFDDATEARALLGGIVTHRSFARAGVLPDFFTSEALRVSGSPDHTRTIAERLRVGARPNNFSQTWHPLNIAMLSTRKTWLANLILNQIGDRAEMANSVEGRPPFLDHKLIEYVDYLPPSVKIMPSGPDATHLEWSFTEKYILREAVRPFITDEIYRRKKLSYNAPISRPNTTNDLTPLQVFLSNRINKKAVDRLGWANWMYFEGVLQEYLGESETSEKTSSASDKQARILLCIASFIVLQEKFDVPTAAMN